MRRLASLVVKPQARLNGEDLRGQVRRLLDTERAVFDFFQSVQSVLREISGRC